jgi:hypothetical protein
MAFCALLATRPVWSDPPQEDQFQTEQFQDDQLGHKHKKRMVRHADTSAQLRHQMRDKINNGLVGIVS